MTERGPPDSLGTLYLADSEATAWAEWYRHLAERQPIVPFFGA